MLFCALMMHHKYLSSFTMIQVYRADRSHHTHLGVTKPYCQLCGSQYIRFNARCKTERKPLPHIFCTARFKQTSVTRYILQIPTTCGMSLFLHHRHKHTHTYTLSSNTVCNAQLVQVISSISCTTLDNAMQLGA